MEQLALRLASCALSESPPVLAPDACDAFGDWLSARLGQPVRVRVTRNRSTMLSASARAEGLTVRLHELFCAATPREIEALVGYLRGHDPVAAHTLDQFIVAQSARLAPARRELRAAGQHHDLQLIFDELNETFFHGSSTARITWGRAAARRYRRSIQLGVYRSDEKLISIHPRLDQAFVPRFYVTWIVYHEMLHDVFGITVTGRRRSMHPPEFAAMEQTYPDFERCKRWEHENLRRLLQGARSRC